MPKEIYCQVDSASGFQNSFNKNVTTKQLKIFKHLWQTKDNLQSKKKKRKEKWIGSAIYCSHFMSSFLQKQYSCFIRQEGQSYHSKHFFSAKFQAVELQLTVTKITKTAL